MAAFWFSFRYVFRPTDPRARGACCFPDDLCLDGIDGEDCDSIGGIYLGDDTTCDGDEDGDGVVGCAELCPDTPPGLPVDDDGCTTPGACCFAAEDVCLDGLEFETCSAIGGVYQGNGSVCPNEVCASVCEGDANADGLVDPLDTGFILARFGCEVDACHLDCSAADQNSDGLVDPLDVGFVLARFGLCETTASLHFGQLDGDDFAEYDEGASLPFCAGIQGGLHFSPDIRVCGFPPDLEDLTVTISHTLRPIEDDWIISEFEGALTTLTPVDSSAGTYDIINRQFGFSTEVTSDDADGKLAEFTVTVEHEASTATRTQTFLLFLGTDC